MGELKPGWKRVKFGEVAECVNDRVDDPAKSGVDRYVGLDHLDPESLTIRRWGTPDEVESTKLRFRPGDIIFGKRRAYQRKLVVADFEGICSAHAMVLRAKPVRVIPEFLPFFMQSDLFMERAVAISVGSLSPTINWKTLAAEEFALPPLEEQRRAVALLGASAAYQATARELVQVAEAAEQAEIQWWFRERARWPAEPMHRVGQVQLGQQKHPKYEAGVAPRPYLRVPNITDGYLQLDEIARMDFVGKDFVKHRLQPGDILITEGDLIGPRTVGRSAMFRGEIADCCIQKTILRFRPGSKLIPEYALWACRHLRYDGVFAKASTGTTVAHLTSEKFKEVLMPIAPDDIQREVVSAAARWSDTRGRILARARSAEALHRGHIDSLWSG